MTEIALLNIGGELLKGRTINTNAAWTGQELGRHGWKVLETIVIRDEAEDIERSLRELMGRFPVVVITGGLGPTKDDITKPTLQKIFGGDLIRSEAADTQIRNWYAKRNRTINDNILLQALVPSSCEVMNNKMGTAPGMYFRQGECHVFSLPGVPQEMKHLISTQVIPRLSAHFPAAAAPARIVKTFNFPESEMAQLMQGKEEEIPSSVDISYLPTDGQVKIELSLKADQGTAEELLEAEQVIAKAMEKHVWAIEDLSLEEVLGRELKRLDLTIALGESCTGGSLAAKITSVSGSSAYFLGSMVTYSVKAKEVSLGLDPALINQFGVVSGEVAAAMAKGAREVLGADIGVGITGAAEVYPDDPDYAEPVIYLGFSSPKKAFVRKLFVYQDRQSNIRRAVNEALFQTLKNVIPDFDPA